MIYAYLTTKAEYCSGDISELREELYSAFMIYNSVLITATTMLDAEYQISFHMLLPSHVWLTRNDNKIIYILGDFPSPAEQQLMYHEPTLRLSFYSPIWQKIYIVFFTQYHAKKREKKERNSFFLFYLSTDLRKIRGAEKSPKGLTQRAKQIQPRNKPVFVALSEQKPKTQLGSAGEREKKVSLSIFSASGSISCTKYGPQGPSLYDPAITGGSYLAKLQKTE